MIRAHVLLWKCIAGVVTHTWVWKWVTVAEYKALPHMDPIKIAAEQVWRTKLAIWACLGFGGLIGAPPAMIYGPPIVQAILTPPGRPPAQVISASPTEQTPIPEPGMLIVFAIGAAITIRLRRCA